MGEAAGADCGPDPALRSVEPHVVWREDFPIYDWWLGGCGFYYGDRRIAGIFSALQEWHIGFPAMHLRGYIGGLRGLAVVAAFAPTRGPGMPGAQ